MDEEFWQEQQTPEEKEWNVYNDDVREELVDADGLDPEEAAFMRGYDDA